MSANDNVRSICIQLTVRRETVQDIRLLEDLIVEYDMHELSQHARILQNSQQPKLAVAKQAFVAEMPRRTAGIIVPEITITL